MPSINSSVAELHKIGKALAKRLVKLQIKTIRDLLFYSPFRYEEYADAGRIADIKGEGNVRVNGVLEIIENRRSRKSHIILTEAVISDGSGKLKLIWFNQPFIKKNLQVGKVYLFSGKVQNEFYNTCLVNPAYTEASPDEVKSELAPNNNLIPVYSLTDGLTQKQVRFLIQKAFDYLDEAEDFIPEAIQAKRGLMPIKEALEIIHRPTDRDKLRKAQARARYESLFWMQGKVQSFKHAIGECKASSMAFHQDAAAKFVSQLPFQLTDDQRKASWRVLQDLQKDTPMNRLLQGDVGSGKTVVAFMAALNGVLSGYQVVLMAPTEILAKQHYQNAVKLLGSMGIEILLLTRGDKRIYKVQSPKFKVQSPKINSEVIEDDILYLSELQAIKYIASGEAQFIIGTHSIIQDKVRFKNLGLVVVDEQHRFGVEQRGLLRKRLSSGELAPHYLSMTATPIPRTAALLLYGDLDISVISQMPPGRKQVITKVISDNERDSIYSFIKAELKQSRQGFVVCPLIDPSDKLGVKSVSEALIHLRQSFPEFCIGSLHGKLKSKEKDSIMKDFKDNRFHLLVSTSVVEVGVDVPNAAIMMIEGAERFGLAQLHQFRGRVGRSGDQAYCFLFPSELAEGIGRLKLMESMHNGLELAQKDLEYRGPGEVYGTKQSGEAGITLPDAEHSLKEMTELMEMIKEDLEEIFGRKEEYPRIIERFKEEAKEMHLE